LDPGDTRCTQAVPEMRLVPQFARHVHEVAAARALPGNSADQEQLRAAAACVQTAGDVIARLASNTTGQGLGLRGGAFKFRATQARYELTLRAVRWTEDLPVSGVLTWQPRSGGADGRLILAGPNGMSGVLKVHWIDGVAQAHAQVFGKLGDARVVAEMPAP